MKHSSLLIKIGVVVIVLLLFIGYLKYQDYQKDHFVVDKKSFNVKTSFSAVMQEDYDKIPTLKNADRYHIVETVNKDIPIVKMQRDLRIEKVWLVAGRVYILTSFKLLKTDRSLEDVPKLTIHKFIFHRKNGPDFTYDIGKSEINADGVSPLKLTQRTFDHRVYQSQVLPFEFNGTDKEKDAIKKADLNAIYKLTLAGMQLITNQKGEAKKTAIKDITVPAQFNFEKYLIDTLALNKKLTIDDVTLTFKSYRQYYDHGELNYKVENPGHMVKLDATTQFDGKIPEPIDENSKNIVFGEFNLTHGTAGEFDIYNPDFKTMTIQPTGYVTKEDQTITFKVTQKQMESLSQEDKGEIQVGTFTHGKIYIGKPANTHREGNFYIRFKQDRHSPQLSELRFVNATNLPTQNIKDEEVKQMYGELTPIKVTNNKGKTIMSLENEGIETLGDGRKVYDFSVDPDEWHGSKAFQFTIQGLMYQEKIKINPITISLKE
ncbi:hypothetical protein JOD43_004387 [Pullulanibacillus pueri]|uniref:Uncharacterized protein n=1 Tax=Pullulanibacillus pueri TaxID=1437324 RepID=A0A8J3A3H6_9BACL|nr:hypothetical protein [Pullulanibacillus pueri]MBM7684174.1 hypothetical protein [Pullulanibacillus pueri]GGH88820.1 hypothetical protein GCM10007096_42020 [Pullulanibacillus pueri]